MSEFTAENSEDLVQNDQIVSPEIQMTEPLATEWTDEKHRLYLSSMEASFVKQLYNLHSNSTDLLGGRERNKLDWDSSRRSDSISSSGQFKVLRGGNWQKNNLERPKPQLDIADETQWKINGSIALPKNQWIQHYRSGGKHREVSSASLQDDCAPSSHAAHVREEKMVSCGVTTSSIHLFAGHKRLYHQDSIESNTEVSDQNFDDEDYKKAPISIKCKAKRKRSGCSIW